jgi:hypothetical protein
MDTARNGMTPVEITETSVAPILRFTQTLDSTTLGRFSGLQLYYNPLGPV